MYGVPVSTCLNTETWNPSYNLIIQRAHLYSEGWIRGASGCARCFAADLTPRSRLRIISTAVSSFRQPGAAGSSAAASSSEPRKPRPDPTWRPVSLIGWRMKPHLLKLKPSLLSLKEHPPPPPLVWSLSCQVQQLVDKSMWTPEQSSHMWWLNMSAWSHER